MGLTFLALEVALYVSDTVHIGGVVVAPLYHLVATNIADAPLGAFPRVRHHLSPNNNKAISTSRWLFLLSTLNGKQFLSPKSASSSLW